MIRVGSIGYATEQGLGRLMKDFYVNGVVTDVMIYEHPNGRPTKLEWYPPGTPVIRGRVWPVEVVRKFLSQIDVLLCFETPFDWNILPLAKEMDVKTVLIPMYEWALIKPPYPFDFYICPSKLDQKYFPGSSFLPIPVNGQYWKERRNALKFLHNAGHIGHREHKGTRELIQALPLIQSPIDITIRSQNPYKIREIVSSLRLPKHKWMTKLSVEGEVPYDNLWDGYDVLVAPEKFNGLSLPLQEAFAAGMLVMTTNRFPMNDWLPNAPLIPVRGTSQVQVMGGHNVIEESEVSPEDIAKTIDTWYGKDIQVYSEFGKQYGIWDSWEALKPTYLTLLNNLVK